MSLDLSEIIASSPFEKKRKEISYVYQISDNMTYVEVIDLVSYRVFNTLKVYTVASFTHQLYACTEKDTVMIDQQILERKKRERER